MGEKNESKGEKTRISHSSPNQKEERKIRMEFIIKLYLLLVNQS